MDVWDSDTLQPKNSKSGETMADCVYYVRGKVYQDSMKSAKNDDKDCDIQSESEDVLPSPSKK